MIASPQQSIASCQMFPAVSIALGEVFCPADNVHAEDGGGGSSCCSARRDETCALSVAHLRSPARIHTDAGATRAPQLAPGPRPGRCIREPRASVPGTRVRTPAAGPSSLARLHYPLSSPPPRAPFPSPLEGLVPHSRCSPERPDLQGGSRASPQTGVLASPLLSLIPFFLSSLVCGGTGSGDQHPSPTPLFFFFFFSFYAFQSAFGFLDALGRKLARGAGYASPDPRLGGLERKLAPPHGLSPLPHPCRLAGGQAASPLPALSSQPSPA